MKIHGFALSEWYLGQGAYKGCFIEFRLCNGARDVRGQIEIKPEGMVSVSWEEYECRKRNGSCKGQVECEKEFPEPFKTHLIHLIETIVNMHDSLKDHPWVIQPNHYEDGKGHSQERLIDHYGYGFYTKT